MLERAKAFQSQAFEFVFSSTHLASSVASRAIRTQLLSTLCLITTLHYIRRVFYLHLAVFYVCTCISVLSFPAVSDATCSHSFGANKSNSENMRSCARESTWLSVAHAKTILNRPILFPTSFKVWEQIIYLSNTGELERNRWSFPFVRCVILANVRCWWTTRRSANNNNIDTRASLRGETEIRK